MASVTIQHNHGGGRMTAVVVKVENDYPDALDQAKRTALDTLAEALCAAQVLLEMDDDED